MNPFSVSPREAWLEVELSKTKQKLAYLERQHNTYEDYSTMYEAQEIKSALICPTLNLAVYGTMYQDYKYDLHCLVRETKPDGVSFGYYLSENATQTETGRADSLANMHEKLVRTIGKKFWG